MPRIARGLAILFALGAVLSGCSGTSETSGPGTQTTTTQPSTTTKTTPAGAQPRLAAEPGRLAQDLIADEQALRDPSTPETTLTQAARRQQVAYRAIGRHPEWDAIIRPRIPAELVAFYDHNVDARRQLATLA